MCILISASSLQSSFHFILSQPEVLHRFICNPFTTFDDDLKRDLVYAWSLPAHPTFKRKMKLIAVAIDEAVLSPLYDYPSCHVFYFKRKIRDVIRVSDIIMFSIKIHLIIFSRNVLRFTACKWRQHHQPSSTATWNSNKSMTRSFPHLSSDMYLHL